MDLEQFAKLSINFVFIAFSVFFSLAAHIVRFNEAYKKGTFRAKLYDYFFGSKNSTGIKNRNTYYLNYIIDSLIDIDNADCLIRVDDNAAYNLYMSNKVIWKDTCSEAKNNKLNKIYGTMLGGAYSWDKEDRLTKDFHIYIKKLEANLYKQLNREKYTHIDLIKDINNTKNILKIKENDYMVLK